MNYWKMDMFYREVASINVEWRLIYECDSDGKKIFDRHGIPKANGAWFLSNGDQLPPVFPTSLRQHKSGCQYTIIYYRSLEERRRWELRKEVYCQFGSYGASRRVKLDCDLDTESLNPDFDTICNGSIPTRVVKMILQEIELIKCGCGVGGRFEANPLKEIKRKAAPLKVLKRKATPLKVIKRKVTPKPSKPSKPSKRKAVIDLTLSEDDDSTGYDEAPLFATVGKNDYLKNAIGSIIAGRKKPKVIVIE